MTPKLKQTIIFTVIFSILALLCVAGGVPQAIDLLTGPSSYESSMDKLLVPDQEDELEKIYTSVTIDNLYGPFDEDVNYTTSTNRYGIESTTKSVAFNYIFKMPNQDRIFQIDAYNIPTKKKLGEFAEAYQAYVNDEAAEKPEPIEITGSFERLWDSNAIEKVIFDAVPVPADGYTLPEERLLEAIEANGIDASALSSDKLEEMKQIYRDAYQDPSPARWKNLLTINYKFVADRLEGDTYMSNYLTLIGFIFMCIAIAVFWISYFRWKKVTAEQNLSLENTTADSDAAPTLDRFVSGKSKFLASETQRISANRKKEVKKSHTHVALGAVLFVTGIVVSIIKPELPLGVLIFIGIIAMPTALFRAKKLNANPLAVEQELYMDFMIQGMTPEKLDAEMSAYHVSGDLDDGHNYTITENFVVQRYPLSTVAVNLNRVLWAGGIFVAQNAKNTEKGAMLYDGTGPVDVATKEGYSRVRSGYVAGYYGVDGEPLCDSKRKEPTTITKDEKSTKILLKELHETHPWIFMGRAQMEYLKNDRRPEAVKIWKQKRQEAEQEA